MMEYLRILLVLSGRGAIDSLREGMDNVETQFAEFIRGVCLVMVRKLQR